MLVKYTSKQLARLTDLELVGFLDAFAGGSRAIMYPPPEDPLTDIDICVHVESVDKVDRQLFYTPFESAVEDYDGDTGTFKTYRKGLVNLLVFQDAYEYGAVMGATSYAKSVNIRSKEDRYDLFERVRLPWRG